MAKIKKVFARQIIDCRCRPMVEVDIVTDDGNLGRGSAPTGSSVGMYESFVLRDHDPREYGGMSVHKAVNNVKNVIAPAIVGRDVNDLDDLKTIDRIMIALDGTELKEKLGGNAIYSTSIAVFRAIAAGHHMPAYRYLCGREIKTVPVPSFNVVNGGRYGDLTLAYNEFLIVPYGAENIYEAVEIGCRVFQELGASIEKYTGLPARTGRSYGYEAPSSDPEVVLSLMRDTVDRCGCHDKVIFALDCASSEMFDPHSKTYLMKERRITAEEMIDYAKNLSDRFPILFIEDLLDENDWEHFPAAQKAIRKSILLGDDLVATNLARLKRAYEEKTIDGFILKPNQVGTLTEAFEAYDFAKSHGMLSIPSGRSGGVVDDIVMDLAVGLEIPFIKNGAPRSGERINKLNFLMRACDTAENCRLSDLSSLLRR